MNILITGASGFLGSALANSFVDAGHQVSILIRKSSNLLRIKDISAFKIGRCDSDVEINQFVSDVRPDVLIHAACCYGRAGESYAQILDSNLKFGSILLGALKNLKKEVAFINAGTVLERNVSFYSLTKIQFEEIGAFIAKTSIPRIQFINVKLQHMFGPGDDQSKFTSYVVNACKSNVPHLPLTLGEQKRDFIYIDDVVDAYIKILDNLSKFDAYHQIDLGSGVAPSLKDFVETVHRLTNSKTELLFGEVPYRQNDAMSMVANIELLNHLGWSPKFDIEAGIKKMIEMEVVK